MSGFTTGVTGFPPPTSFAGFLGLLQTATFRGVPFKVVGSQVKKGRRLAVHEYPFRDGGWAEDMGRALRAYSFTGYLIGDLAPVLQLALDNAIEARGPGLLIHPTLGALRVSVASASTAVHRDRGRVIEVAFEFVEQTDTVFPTAYIATAVNVLAAAASSLVACNQDLGGVAGPAAATGSTVTGEGQTVVSAFVGATALGGGDATAIVGLATALPAPDNDTSYGRYSAGSASLVLAVGITVATLQGQLAAQRAAIATAGATAVATAGMFTATTDMMDPLSNLVEAMRTGMNNPADQVRVLLNLAVFSYRDSAGGSIGISADRATMRDAMAAACRRAALVSLARASATYQPVSYEDAATLRALVAAALDVEITAAGDAGEDDTYAALKTLRACVVRDLTVRGASLPTVVAVNLPLNLPSLTIAQRLYQDASRSDEIAGEAHAIHPAFCPLSFQALSA